MSAPKRQPVKVMVFGVFDFLHQGHQDFLKQAGKLGDKLIVSVARDANVLEFKGHLPVFSERERLNRLSRLKLVNKAVLGARSKKSAIAQILDQKPDIIGLGYDQHPYLAANVGALEQKLKACGLSTKVVRLKSFKPKSFKTNKIRFISEVVSGHKKRGTSLGFPTANLKVSKDIPEGIYIARTTIFSSSAAKRSREASSRQARTVGLPSLVFVGPAITFNEKKYQAEVYILDFNGDLYGQKIKVELLRKIRDNKKFKSADKLVKAMKQDEQIARQFFKTYSRE